MFRIEDRSYGDLPFREFDDEPAVYKAKGLLLGTLVSHGLGRFVYVYDYGDNCRPDVNVKEVRDGDPDTEYPAFEDGARCCPPEDAGGPDDFVDFLEAIHDSAQEEHWAMLDWYGGLFEPVGFEGSRAGFRMENIARRRRAARAKRCGWCYQQPSKAPRSRS